MATVSQISHLFWALRRYLLRILKEGNPRHAFTRILQRLAFLGYLLRAKWSQWKKGTVGKVSSAKKTGFEHPANRPEHTKTESLLFSNTPNGEIVSLEDVAFSFDPSGTPPHSRTVTPWTHLHFEPQVEARSEFSQYEARSTSTIVEFTEVTSRQEISTVSTMHILSQSASIAYLAHPRIKPAMPESFRHRTGRQVGIDQTGGKIEPLTTKFERSSPRPGWIRQTHSDGAYYFCNQEKRVYTDADLSDYTIFKQALEDISTLEEFISTHDLALPKNSDLVMDLFYDETNLVIQTVYYFVHHPSKSVFFLDHFETEKLATWYKTKGIKSDTQLRDEIEAQYWLYLQLYPGAGVITTSMVRELRDKALHFIGEYMSSETATTSSIYTLEDLYKILALTDNLEKNIGSEPTTGAISLLSRLMETFAHSRLNTIQGVAPAGPMSEATPGPQFNKTRRTWFIKITSPLFFSAPNFYLHSLQEMRVGLLSHTTGRNSVVRRLNDDWRQFILFAILLLIANVAFLGIQSVDINHIPRRSAAQISSYLSAVFSIGSIVLGLLLLGHTRMARRGVNIADGRHRFRNSRIGFEIRAIFYSLPYVLLMWGMIAFVVAFSFLCFHHSSKITRILVGTFGAAMAVLVLLCVWTSWGEYLEYESVESSTDCREHSSKPAMLSRLSSLPASLTVRGHSSEQQKTAV
ncbi:hypothetical protein GALMADRAFT_223014 [Galerina marginata CBS 339.88]|uniref:WW domain-containing protein n=1 Tax=Galerina marginata (strain CBS 339.88) TaxID=685588 RepID=A0A067TA82_GALM3|nr:hypothetical protein GALMADRAFT_223014 [Galerina marginata CBS 339.88]